MRTTSLIVLVVVQCCTAMLHAQNEAKTVIEIHSQSSLQDLLEYAEKNNPDLSGRYLMWQSAKENANAAGKLPDPMVSYSYMAPSVNDLGTAMENRFNVMQAFPWFGTLGQQKKSAAAAASAANAGYEMAKRDLHLQVKTIYFEYALTISTLNILRENIQLMNDLEEVLRYKFRTGESTYASLLKIQVEVDRLQNDLQSYEQMLPVVKARLNYVLNRPGDAELPAQPHVNIDTLALDDTQLQEKLLESNPLIAGADAEIRQAQSEAILAQKRNYPSIALGIEYQQRNDNLGMSGSNPDPLMFMVSMNLPIFFGKNRAAVAAEKTRLRASETTKIAAENMLLNDLQMTLFEYRDALRKVRLYREQLIPKARQALEVAQTAFETGKMDFLDWIDAQRTLLNFELELANALTRGAQKRAELTRLTGL